MIWIHLTADNTAEINMNSQSVCSFWLARQSTLPFPIAKHCLSYRPMVTSEESGCESGCLLEKRKRKSGTKGHESNCESELALSSKAKEIVDN